ncbi:MAG TPA: amidohydrolase family protein [Gammaproteobacteria bacterium]
MRNRLRALIAASVVLSASLVASQHASAQAPAAGTVAFVGARLIDGSGSEPIENAALVVEDGRVAAVGPAEAIRVPDGAVRIDVTGKTIIPGLVNAHGHVQVEQNGTLPVRDDLLRRLRTYASYGVTTVVSLGSGARDEAESVALAADQRAGRADGARLYTSGRAVAGRTPEESRAAVDRLADLGVDVIKLRLNGGPNDPSFETFKAQVDQAHARGLRTVVHIFNLADAQMAVDAGVDVIGHSVRDRDVTPEFIAALEDRNVYYVPTLTRDLSVFVYESTPAFFDDPFFLRGESLYREQIPMLTDSAYQQRIRQDPNAQSIKQALEQAQRNLGLLADAGVPIAMGTDSGAAGSPGRWQGYFEHVELEMMVESGMTPMEALVAATSGAASAMGLADVGTLEVGKLADFIVLDADPLEDISNTRRIESVWMSGKRIEPSGGAAP